MIGIKKVRIGSKVYKYNRNYKTEYLERTSAQKNNRGKRRKARTLMEQMMGKAALRGMDIDHIKGIKNGNGRKNLRVTTKKFNRSRK